MSIKRSIIFIIFSVTIICIIDIKNIDNVVYQLINPNFISYYDIPIWQFLGFITTLWAVVVALYTSSLSLGHVEKQLKIEQMPYVVAVGGINIIGIEGNAKKEANYLCLKIKNIGRGPALRITVSGNPNDSESAFFLDNEPHSCDLGSNEEKAEWKIDEGNLEKSIRKQIQKDIHLPEAIDPFHLYIYYSDQLGIKHTTKVRLCRSGNGRVIKVLENTAV